MTTFIRCLRFRDVLQGMRRGWVRDEEGSGLVEMAFCFPVFAMLLFGFINFCMYTLDLCNVTYATRTALRYACLHGANSPNPATITDMYNFVHPLDYKFPANSGTIQISYPSPGGDCSSSPGSSDTPGQTVMVCVLLNVHMNIFGYAPSGLTLNTATQGVVIH